MLFLLLLVTTLTIRERLKVALIQLAVGPDKAKNIAAAVSEIHKAKEKGAQLVALPECFNSPYGIEYFEGYAEPVPTGETSVALSKAAKDTGVCVVGGTFSERCGNQLFNTCTVWNGKGELIATYRKMHLSSEESKVLSAGNKIATFDYGSLTIGIGIGSELKVCETSALMAKQGCSLLIYPGAFDMTTGRRHWEPLSISRAKDNILWVALVSRARNTKEDIAWGRTMLIEPTGDIFNQLGEKPDMLQGYVDLKAVQRVRKWLIAVRKNK